MSNPLENSATVAAADHPIGQVREPLPNVAPTLRLSRRGLVLSLLAMAGAGLSVYSLFPESIGGPSLPVEVLLDRRLVDTVGGRGAIVADVVVVRNLAEHPIPRLSLDINGQYLLFREAPLEVKEEFVVPQQVFTDKRSSQRFDPKLHQVDDVIARGQLPSGARGVSKFEFVDGRPKTNTNSEP
jgi:hypothetical protein